MANSWLFQTSLFPSLDTHRWDYTSHVIRLAVIRLIVMSIHSSPVYESRRPQNSARIRRGSDCQATRRFAFALRQFFLLAISRQRRRRINIYRYKKEREREGRGGVGERKKHARNRYLFKRPFPGAFSDSIFLFFRNFVSRSPRRAADKETRARQRRGKPGAETFVITINKSSARAGQNVPSPFPFPLTLPRLSPPPESTNALR